MVGFDELNWGFIEILYLIIIFIIGFIITILIIPLFIKLMKKKHFVGHDIHKNSKPEIAESGGISIVFGFTVVSFLLIILFPRFFNEILIFTLTVILAGIIGFIDDRIRLKSRYKVLLTLFTGILIFIANFYGFINIQSPTIPFLGKLRLTLIYPILAPIIVAVFANTTNMLEGYNGEGSGSCLIALGFLFICGILWNSAEAIIFTLAAISVITPFFLYNKYPSKIFPGDVGTLAMGGILACIALFASLEAAVFCALLVHIFNSFYVLYSVRGFFESSQIQDKKSDIILLEDDTIKASNQKDAALTLPRLILAKGPLKEAELVNNIYIISVICGFFSIIATLLMLWTIKIIGLFIIFICITIFGVLIAFLLLKYPRIRGIIILMIILLAALCVLLVFIDLLIMPIDFVNLNFFGLILPTNLIISFALVIPVLLIWYYLTIKYFWKEINKMKQKN
jgi:UDP-N-acetylglucosamine--dolichyl-phosphate N-acetylglucosaminephosphotransferase